MLTEGCTEEEADAVARHFAYLEGLLAEGRLVLAGRTQTADASTFGIVVFTAESEQAAWDDVAADPAVSAGVFRAEVFPFRTALAPGLA
jgi:uncharacterized protein YciI